MSQATPTEGRFCSVCKTPVAASHTGPCPKCGAENCSAATQGKAGAGASAMVWTTNIREYYERHSKTLVVVLFITVFGPLTTFFLGGTLGVAAGTTVDLSLAVIGLFLHRRAGKTVREIEHEGQRPQAR
jgi:hypothetical protein